MAQGGNWGTWFDVTEPTVNYVGRDKEHKILDKLFSEWMKINRLIYVIMTGLGGVGKSEVAINFARTFQEKVEESNCIWINAETKDSQLDSFQKLAREFSLPLENESKNSLDTLVEILYPKITQHRCLLIFDNIESYEDPIFKILNEVAKKSHPKTIHPFVIITSRSIRAKEFFGAKAEHMQLNNLPWLSANEFVTKSLSKKCTDPQCLRKLCERLHGLPLALHQAVAVINKGLQYQSTVEYEVKNYLEQFEKLKKKIIDAELPIIEKPNRDTIYRTWSVTLEKIGKEERFGEIAKNTMIIVAFLSNFCIKISFLKEILKLFPNNNQNDDKDIQQAIELLASYSMCTINREEETISVHRLVQDVIRARLINSNDPLEYLGPLDHLLTIVGEKSFINQESFPLSQVAHLRSLWNHAAKYPQLIEKHANLPPLISEHYILCSRYDECYSFITEEVIDVFEKWLGEECRNTLWILYWKACALEKLGKYPESRELLLKCYQNQMKIMDENDDHILRSAQVIGSTYWHEENFDEAMKWFGMVLPRRIKHFGEENEQTLVLKNNMALAFIDQGKHQEGLEILSNLYEVKSRTLGSDHLETLITKHNVALAYFSLQDYDKASVLLAEVIREKETAFQIGPSHAETSNSLHLLARTLKEMKKYKEAISVAEKTFKLREILFSIDHPKTNNTKTLIDDLRKLAQEE